MGCLPLLIWWTLALHVYCQFRCSLVCILTLPRLQFWKFKLMYLQFIVVSLKEGMFNNANVIFRTKFVDGVSTVTRTVPSKQRWPVYTPCFFCRYVLILRLGIQFRSCYLPKLLYYIIYTLLILPGEWFHECWTPYLLLDCQAVCCTLTYEIVVLGAVAAKCLKQSSSSLVCFGSSSQIRCYNCNPVPLR